MGDMLLPLVPIPHLATSSYMNEKKNVLELNTITIDVGLEFRFEMQVTHMYLA